MLKNPIDLSLRPENPWIELLEISTKLAEGEDGNCNSLRSRLVRDFNNINELDIWNLDFNFINPSQQPIEYYGGSSYTRGEFHFSFPYLDFYHLYENTDYLLTILLKHFEKIEYPPVQMDCYDINGFIGISSRSLGCELDHRKLVQVGMLNVRELFPLGWTDPDIPGDWQSHFVGIYYNILDPLEPIYFDASLKLKYNISECPDGTTDPSCYFLSEGLTEYKYFNHFFKSYNPLNTYKIQFFIRGIK